MCIRDRNRFLITRSASLEALGMSFIEFAGIVTKLSLDKICEEVLEGDIEEEEIAARDVIGFTRYSGISTSGSVVLDIC